MTVNNDYLEALGFEFVAWAKQQKHEKKPLTYLKDFYELKDIDKITMRRWCKKNKTLRRAKDQAKMILGNLRENGAIRREFHPGLILKSMHMYDDAWKDVNNYYADFDLKKKMQEEEKHSGVINMYIPKLVPEDKPFDKNDYELLVQHQIRK